MTRISVQPLTPSAPPRKRRKAGSSSTNGSSRHPSVSVVMPVYNTAAFVSEAIESILRQTYEDFEFIIVDDGSTDATPRILRAYAERDTRIRIVPSTHGGISAATNRGSLVREPPG